MSLKGPPSRRSSFGSLDGGSSSRRFSFGSLDGGSSFGQSSFGSLDRESGGGRSESKQDVLAGLMATPVPPTNKQTTPCHGHLVKADLDGLREPIDKALNIHQDSTNPIQLWKVSDTLRDLCTGTTRGGPLPAAVLAIRLDGGDLNPPPKYKLGLLVLENPDLGVERREEEADVYTLLDPAVLLDPKFYGDAFFDLNASFIGDEIPVAQELGRLMAPGYRFELNTPVYNGTFKIVDTTILMKREGKEVYSLTSKPQLDGALFASGLLFLMLASKATVLEFDMRLYPDPKWTLKPVDLGGKWVSTTNHPILGKIVLRFIESSDGEHLQGVMIYKRYDHMPDEKPEAVHALKTDLPIVYTTSDGARYVHVPGMADNEVRPIHPDGRVSLTETRHLDELGDARTATNSTDFNMGWVKSPC